MSKIVKLFIPFSDNSSLIESIENFSEIIDDSLSNVKPASKEYFYLLGKKSAIDDFLEIFKKQEEKNDSI